MNKGKKITELSSTTVAKIGRNESVTLDVVDLRSSASPDRFRCGNHANPISVWSATQFVLSFTFSCVFSFAFPFTFFCVFSSIFSSPHGVLMDADG